MEAACVVVAFDVGEEFGGCAGVIDEAATLKHRLFAKNSG